jgi:ADP-ribose pyrophosphatase YjhB (NUDIX family)
MDSRLSRPVAHQLADMRRTSVVGSHLAQLLRLRLAGFRSCRAGASFVAVTGAIGDEAGQWRTFGEREVYSSPDVQLRQVDVELAGGERVWHHVVRLHRVALMALVDEPGRVLLLKRHRLVPDRWGWEVPGGPVDEGEGSDGAAIRELEDSTGYRAGRFTHLITFQPMAGPVGAEHSVFVGQDPVQVGEPTVISGVGRAEWVPLESVPGLIAAGEIWNAGSLVALLRLLTMDGQAVSH